MNFARFAAIDWSGAKGKRHKGIAVAMAEAGPSTACAPGARDGLAAPALVRPGHAWSRCEVLDWLVATAAEAPTLFGFDCSFAPPIHERGAYLPGEKDVPTDARAFWAYVDRLSDDEDLGAASFLEKAHRRHFYFGAADGAKRDFLHHRACEHAFNATGGGKASTLYDAIGAGQVAKASFAGMRLLHHLAGRVPVWPFDYAQDRPFDMMEPPSPRPGDEAAPSSQDRPFDMMEPPSPRPGDEAPPSSQDRPFDMMEPPSPRPGEEAAPSSQDRPFDPVPEWGSVVVEIYTRAFIRLAGLSGRKVRTVAQLDEALAAFGSNPAGFVKPPNDHETDVLIAAAGLRAIAPEPRWWNPAGLTPELARTEGWTFGVA